MMRISTLVLFALAMPVSALGQTATSSASSGPAANIAGDSVILAKLAENLDLQHCSVGDQWEAQTTADVKQGKEVLLKKGSSVLGHVVSVQPATSNQAESNVIVVFDTVKPKNGGLQTLHLVIRALAPEEQMQSSSTVAGGRGMQGEDTHAGLSGSDRAESGGVTRLNASSVGVAGIPGLDLEIKKSTTGQQMSVLSWSKGDIKLKKSTQIAFLVVGS